MALQTETTNKDRNYLKESKEILGYKAKLNWQIHYKESAPDLSR